MTRRHHGPHHGSAPHDHDHAHPHPDHAHPHHDHAHPHHDHDAGAAQGAFSDADALTLVLDDPARDEWQRPDDILRALELEPTLTVADLGAGTGYFAVRLARAVPRGAVLAVDVEPDLVRFLTERARREQLPNLRVVQATPGVSSFTASSLDRILVVHVWHHLANRHEHARSLAAALRPGGKLLIVDFSPSSERGPPAAMRLGPEAVIAELEAEGLAASVAPLALPDQYVVQATR